MRRVSGRTKKRGLKKSPEYSEITPVTQTSKDGVIEYLAPDLQYTSAIFTRYGPIVYAKFHGTCPYELGVNTYARIKNPIFIPKKEINVAATFVSGTTDHGTGTLQFLTDGTINIIPSVYGLNWIYADIFYII